MTKKSIILLCVIGFKFLIQFLLLSSEYDMLRDEYLHIDQANHLACALTIAISKQFSKNYLKLGQWILLLIISGHIYFGTN